MRKIKLFLVIILLVIGAALLSSCMTNYDYHIHKMYIDTSEQTILVEDKDDNFASYKIGANNIGITIDFPEYIDSFSWTFNVFQKDISYTPVISYNDNGSVTIYVPHDFNKYPMGDKPFYAITYLVEEHLHFIINLN